MFFNNIASGNLTSSRRCGNTRFPTISYHVTLDCSRTTDSICYFITRTASSSDHQICKVNFDSATSISYADIVGVSYYLSNSKAVDDNTTIVAGFYTSNLVVFHSFFKFNFGNGSFEWEKTSSILGK